MGSIIKKIVSLVGLLLSLYGFNSCASELNVKSFGASERSEDNTEAFQKCLRAATDKGCNCYVPAGTYYFTQDLFMSSSSSLIGQGETSKLIFNKGGIRGYKNGSANFYYTNNYNNEVVPNEQHTNLISSVPRGRGSIVVLDAASFKVGDHIVVFNNKLDSWTILEDKTQSARWNGARGDYFAKGGSFKIKSIKGNTLFLETNLPFDLPEGSKIALRSGVSNVTIKKLSIVRKTDGYAILLEQPFQVKISQVTIKGLGGILLSHYANKCLIEGNKIDAERGYAVCIENFSSENAVSRNKVIFRRTNSDKGGDCAVILLMGAYNNLISYNNLENIGNRERDFGGIFSHALSFNNQIINNRINGGAEGIGTYYASFNNLFSGNVISKVRVGVMSYYSRSNVYRDNSLEIHYQGKENSYGILDYGAQANGYEANRIVGRMTFGLQIQGSTGLEVKSNNFQQVNTSYSVGVNISDNDLLKKSIYDSNSFTGYKIK
ncbi:right-handed parallel beta-helix repeat-containing protein [Sphingobacterium prati]|uniref:right-handed parallel beta-helix repeat-containing protein n=1 Tax=Sphingobacterium prati TaxID=2737006 RepID=UPI0015573725|nr:right-handed parallel beta-helix repeat-containing protein [Sphingobacterium prati]NPE45861.1 hypothetical protein [Sphingobacterium prati]